jgi:hypothetical protein
MRSLLTLLISVLLVTSACHVQSREIAAQPDIPAEEYAIYNAVIGVMFAGDKVTFDTQAMIKMLVIEDLTVNSLGDGAEAESEAQRLKQAFSTPLPQEIIDDYVAKNAKPHRLTKSLDLKLKYTLIPKDKIDPNFTGAPSDEFYKQFPDSGGYIALSRAGLNSNGNHALVFMQHICGGLCGSGHYIPLVKNDQGWVVQKHFRAWVA